MFSISGQELVVLLLVAIVVVGPARLPLYAREFRGWVAKARGLLAHAGAAARDEMGDTVDFSGLDPRQFDPRQIVNDAPAEPVSAAPSSRSDGRAARRRSARTGSDAVAPFDADAT